MRWASEANKTNKRKMQTTPPTTEEIASHIMDWSIERILTGGLNEKDALAIAEEFAE